MIIIYGHASTFSPGDGSVLMEHRQINAFAEQKLEDSLKLAWARDLQRMWSDVLQEPLPTDFRRLIDKLEQVTGGTSAAGRSRSA